jgi:CRP/FNR family transcriptional regulator, cyclic AMP receptor protein
MKPSPPIAAALRAALASDPWFASCAPAFQTLLLAHAQTIALTSGTHLFSRGQRADGLCCVVAGALRVGALQADGRESLLAYVEPYQWFGEISMLDDSPRTHDAVAEGDTQVLQVPQAALHAGLRAQPEHWRDLARLACGKLRVLFTVLEDIAHLPLAQRLAKRLCLLAHGYGARPDRARREIRLPQEQLALMLGVTRQSTNKALRALESQGLIALRYGAIELLDMAGLKQLAGMT